MLFNFDEMPPNDRYKLLVSTVVPRPIALVTSVDAAGIVNAGPYSFFNAMSSNPAIVVIGVGKPSGKMKDTGTNIRTTREFVVNLVSEKILDQMNVTAIDFPPEVDELAEAGLTAAPCDLVRAPRIAESPVAMECILNQVIDIGPSNDIVIGEVKRFHIADEHVNLERMHVDTPALELVGRMHGAGWYARTTDRVEVKRIPLDQWDAKKSNAAE